MQACGSSTAYFWLWGAIYGAAAIFTGFAAFRPGSYASPGFRGLYLVALIAAIFGLFYYWPDTPNWWMQDVWWETETAREGMGMMIILVAMLAAGTKVLSARRGA